MSLMRALSPYARAAERRRAQAGEACELCAQNVGPGHPHVVDLSHRKLCCACRACALLFDKPGAAGGRYRTIPTRVLADPELVVSEEDWTALEIPVRLAFAFQPAALGRWFAVYPSPAGPTEAEVPQAAWSALLKRSALVRRAEPGVEALLFYGGRRPGFGFEVLLVPIDACYELVGLVRVHWKGFDGGDAHREIASFIERLRARSRPLRRAPGGAS